MAYPNDSRYRSADNLKTKYLAVSASGSGPNLLLAAITEKRIRVLSYTLIAAAAVTVQFRSAIGGNDLTGAMPFGASGGASPASFNDGLFETISGEALYLILGGAVAVAGHISYVEVKQNA